MKFTSTLFAFLSVIGLAAANTCPGEYLTVMYGEENQPCLMDEICRGILFSYADLAVNSGLYQSGWYLDENGIWSNDNQNRFLRGAEDDVEQHQKFEEFNRKLSDATDQYKNHERNLLSCERCMELFENAYICLQYTGTFCRRRLQDQDQDLASFMQEANDSCYRDVGVDFDVWLYMTMKWIADQYSAHHLIESIQYRVRERKSNSACPCESA